MGRTTSRQLWAQHLKSGGAAAGVKRVRGLSVATQPAGSVVASVQPKFTGCILGVDPSLRGTGFAVIKVSSAEAGGMRLLHSVTLKLKRDLPPSQCFGEILKQTEILIDAYKPTCAAVEQTILAKSPKIAMTLGATRGAAIAPIAALGLPVFEYAPLRMKQAITGNGRASKQQVQAAVKNMLQLKTALPADEADAAAVALTHSFTHK